MMRRKEEDERRMETLSLSRASKAVAIFAIAMRNAQHQGFGEGVEWPGVVVVVLARIRLGRSGSIFPRAKERTHMHSADEK